MKTFEHTGLISKQIDYEPKHVIAADTDSSMLDLSAVFDRDADPKEVIAFADMIGVKSNEAFPDFLLDVFNIPKDKLHIINTEREVVADKTYMLAKKNYVMHIIDNEGKTEDKLKVVGVAIKKSDTPVIIQNFLTDLVNLLLDKTSYKKVKLFIDNYKEEYHTLSASEIGNPTAVNKLKKYQMEYADTKLTKGFPQNVKASMNFNSLCAVNDVKIMSGGNIRIIYVNHPTFKVMALPVGVDVLPEFISDIDVNWGKQWETVQKKIDIFLTPIGYDVKGRQRTLNKSLLIYR